MNPLLALLVAHFIGDFLLQSDWMATQKSKNADALLAHTGIYSLCFLPWGLMFVLLTFLTHTLTDYATSQLTSALWFFRQEAEDGCDPPLQTRWVYVAGRRHWFFVVIGFDQLIHAATLALTLWSLA